MGSTIISAKAINFRLFKTGYSFKKFFMTSST
jgi:hypothetical protein